MLNLKREGHGMLTRGDKNYVRTYLREEYRDDKEMLKIRELLFLNFLFFDYKLLNFFKHFFFIQRKMPKCQNNENMYTSPHLFFIPERAFFDNGWTSTNWILRTFAKPSLCLAWKETLLASNFSSSSLLSVVYNSFHVRMAT